jgi:multiple sugar transport system ATP-binding protein
MDEPLSNLDAKLRTETRAQIVKLQRSLATTTIYVTHDQTEAMTMGDRIAVMSHGEIQQLATPLEIYNHPANRFVAQFIGSPPMNFISVKLEGKLAIVHSQFRFTLPEIWLETLQADQGRELLLGIRPEHLSLSVAAPKNIPVVVDLVEALGNDTFITAQIERSGETIQARVSPDHEIKIGQTAWLGINTSKLHFFDPDTERAIDQGVRGQK